MDPPPFVGDQPDRRIWTSPGTQINNMMNVYTTMKDVICPRKMSTIRPEKKLIDFAKGSGSYDIS
ncbi:hypothetical protein PHMEG_00033842 [Phytophthora megakarya]|uniref:Uncharacterized protein n=1 Tax=Phytophthora megakarya TaxID=4795 RepID=A0A225USK8_9STRA|nr:hypothetical protein PHMEG_00033842 [Phytophthora megakarya]